MKRFVLTLAALLGLSGCATGYHSSSLTGGLTQTRLSERVYQVRFQGNGYTSQERTSVFLLRRCAELTLENGFRYFTLGAQGTGSMESGASGFIFRFPHGTATVKFLEKEADDPTPLDALIVVKDTEERSGGRLSDKAKWQIRIFEGKAAPIVAGTTLWEPTGELYGDVLESVPDHRFPDGTVSDAVHVKKADGEKVWVAFRHVLKLRSEPPAFGAKE